MYVQKFTRIFGAIFDWLFTRFILVLSVTGSSPIIVLLYAFSLTPFASLVC